MDSKIWAKEDGMIPRNSTWDRIPSRIRSVRIQSLGSDHFTFHRECFSCSRLTIGKDGAVETFQYGIDQTSYGLFIDILLFRTKPKRKIEMLLWNDDVPYFQS